MATPTAFVGEQTTTVYYDGLCHLCAREINHYRGMKGSSKLKFVDITDATFDAATEGLDPVEVHKNMHVRDRQGQLQIGVDAFIGIWSELPATKVRLVNTRQVRARHF